MRMTYFPGAEALVSPVESQDQDTSVTARFLETLRRRRIGEAVVAEMNTTLLSARDGSPSTVLGALLEEDGQSAAAIETRLLGVEPPVQVGPVLDALQTVGLVESHDDHGVLRYSLVPPDETV